MAYLKDPIKEFSPLRYPGGSVVQYFAEGAELYNTTKGHSGWDIIRPWGEPIYAMADGIVANIDHDEVNGYGNHIRILTEDQCHIYGHLSEMFVNLNQQVKAGDLIGKMGNTGFVVSQGFARQFWKAAGIDFTNHPGTHLHITIIPTEPADHYDASTGCYQFQNGMYRKFTYFNNGYGGCVDPSIFFRIPHSFTKAWKRGQTSDDILYMQFILKKQGVLDKNVDVIGFWGQKTSDALLTLQKREAIAPILELEELKGENMGPRTRAMLTRLSQE